MKTIFKERKTAIISEEKKEEWRQLLRQIPVVVNNFYGDPVIQWENTINKLENLTKCKHIGPVGIILKGELKKSHINNLVRVKESGLNIVCLVSISELPKMEGTGSEHRYENIRMLVKAGVPAIAYIRPMMPPFNTSEEVIGKIFSKLQQVGCKVAVTSGFRGDEDLVNKLAPDERVEWAMRVKIMPNEVYARIKLYAEKHKIQLFTRTSCAVSFMTGGDRTYNPYYNSPKLVKCEELNCPLRKSCGSLQEPKKGSIELLKFMGFDIEFIPGSGKRTCDVSGADRLKCPSCCTTCYFSSNIPHILVHSKVNLGALAFIRFVSGMMAMQPNLNDDGSKDIGKIKFPNYPHIDNAQALNSWWPMSRNIDKCYGCTYCIVHEYYNENEKNTEVGFLPVDLIDKMFT